MPELVNSRVGSLPGTSGADGTMVWPLLAKEFEEIAADLAADSLEVVIWAGNGVAGTCWSR